MQNPCHLEVVSLTERLVGSAAPDTGAAHGNLALLYISLGRFLEALRHLDLMDAAFEASFPPEHAAHALAFSHRALMYSEQGQFVVWIAGPLAFAKQLLVRRTARRSRVSTVSVWTASGSAGWRMRQTCCDEQLKGANDNWEWIIRILLRVVIRSGLLWRHRESVRMPRCCLRGRSPEERRHLGQATPTR